MKIIGKNSRFNRNSKAETLQNVRIRKRIEYTGFLDVITKTDEDNAKLEKKEKKKKNNIV